MSHPHLNKFAAIAALLLSSSVTAYAAPNDPTTQQTSQYFHKEKILPQ